MNKLAIGAVLCLSGVGWILLLAGTGNMQMKCGEANYELGSGSGSLGAGMPCDKLLGFTWWSVFLELFVLLGITATLFLPDPERYKIPAVAYLAVATAIIMVGVNTFLAYNNLEVGNQGGPRTVVAGGIILSTCNLLLIGLVGGARQEDEWVVGPAKTVAEPAGPRVVEMPAF